MGAPTFSNYINGEWKESGSVFEDRNPANVDEVVGLFVKGSAGDVEPGWGGAVHDALFGTKRRQGMIETMGKQMVRTAGSQLGRQILRGVLGGIFGGKR